MIWQTNLSAPNMTEVMSSCSQSRNYLTVPQIFSCWKDRHFHNRFTFVTWLNNMPLPTFSVLLGGNLTSTNYTLTCAQIKVTHTLVWGNITLVSSAIAIHELQKIMSKNVKANTGLFEMIVKVLTTATSFSRYNPMWFISMGLHQGSGLCSSSSCKYSGMEGMNQNHHWNRHHWHATHCLEQTRLSCWCLQNHKGSMYTAHVCNKNFECWSIK